MKRRDFLKSVSAAGVATAVAAPAAWSPSKAQSRQETLLIVSESGPNNLDVQGVGTSVPSYEISWNSYDRLISHEMKEVNGTPYYDRDKFKMELAEDMNVGDMSATFKLKKNAKFHDGTPITAKDVKWSLDRAVSVGGFPTFQMKAGSLEKPEQFVVVDEHTVRVDFIRKDRLTIPDLAVVVPCVMNSELVRKNATEKDPWGLDYTKQNIAGGGAYRVVSWTAGTEITLERNDAWANGPLPKVKKVIWRMVPSAGNRRALLERGDADISYELPNKDFAELKAAGKLSIVSTPFSNGVQYIGYERHQAAVRQSEGAPGRGASDSLPEDHGRCDVRPRQADVWPRRRSADRSRMATAAPLQHRHREGEGIAGRSGLRQRLRDHDVVRPRVRHRQRASLCARPGIAWPDRHQANAQQGSRCQLADRTQQEGDAALHEHLLGLARLPRVLLLLVLSWRQFRVQYDEATSQRTWIHSSTVLALPPRSARPLPTRRTSRASSISPSPTCRAFRCSSPTPMLRCRRTCRATNTGSTAASTIARWLRLEDCLERPRSMLGLIGKRMVMALPSLVGVVIVTFLLTRALPGDPAAYFAGPAANAEAIEQVRVKLGLDRSLPVQFTGYVGDLASGNLGNSLTTGQPVLTEIRNRLPASAELTLLGLIVSMTVALPLGMLAALKPGSAIDHACRIVTTAGVSLPVFFTGLLLVYVFYFRLGIAPAPLGRLDVFASAPPTVTGFYLIDSLIAGQWETFRASLAQLVLPALTLGLFALAPIARMTRAAMLSTLGSEFARMARSSGLSPWTVVVTYAFRNAMLPVITTLGMVFSFLLGANVLVEKVFAWPGIGSYAVEALIASDFAPVQGFVLTMAIMYVALNLLIDILYGLIDPRVRIEA